MGSDESYLFEVPWLASAGKGGTWEILPTKFDEPKIEAMPCQMSASTMVSPAEFL